MNTRNSVQRIVTSLLIAACPSALYAFPVRTYTADFNLRIPAYPDGSKGWMTDAVIDIKDHFTIHDLDVQLNVIHTKVFDLQIFLKSPAGSTICLNMYNFDEYFDGENYTDTVFDDEALTPIENAAAPFTGRFKPRQGFSLDTFDGQSTFGRWRLRIYDARPADTGILNNFSLIVTVPEPSSALILLLATGLITFGKPRPSNYSSLAPSSSRSRSRNSSNKSSDESEHFFSARGGLAAR